MKICVIIAGGCGQRFGETPKQFFEINNKKIIEITYDNSKKIFDEIYVVVNEKYKKIKINCENIYYVKSNCRLDTIINFLKIKPFNDDDLICIKDANTLFFPPIIDKLENKTTIFRHCLDSSQYLTKNNKLIKREEIYENVAYFYLYSDLKLILKEEKIYDYQSEFQYLLEKNKINFVDTNYRTIKITYIEDIEFIKQIQNL